MLKISFLVLISAVPALAQLASPGNERSFFHVDSVPVGPMLQFNAVAEPPLSNPADLKLGWGVFYARTPTHDVWHRVVYDTVHRQYFGYDLLVDPPQVELLTNQPRIRNQYRVTFAPLSLEPAQIEPKGLSPIAPAKYPKPQMLMPGDVIAVDLLVSPDGNRKVVDYIHISPADGLPSLVPFSKRVAYFNAENQSTRMIYERFGRLAGIGVSFDPGVATASGKLSLALADVAPEDAFNLIAIATHTYWKPTPGNSILVTSELPRPKSTGDPNEYTVDDGVLKFDFIGEALVDGRAFDGQRWFIPSQGKGATAWFSFPGKGRFILSLVPHEGFSNDGEVRDNAFSFRAEGHAYQITMNSPIVQGGGAWKLYVLHDQSYQLDALVAADLPSGLAHSSAPMVIGGTDRLENLVPKGKR